MTTAAEMKSNISSSPPSPSCSPRTAAC
jgi:hypothetical protein